MTVNASNSPSKVAEIIERSRLTRPRTTETSETFDALVNSSVASVLKEEGFNKRALTWHRHDQQVWPIIQLCKGRSDGDFMEFWFQWGVLVPGFAEIRYGLPKGSLTPAHCPVRGTVGDIAGAKSEIHWMIALGCLGQFLPERRIYDARPEVASILRETVVPFLARFSTIDDVRVFLRERPSGFAGESEVRRTVEVLADLSQ